MVVLLRKTGLAHLLAISGINVAIFFITHSFLVRGVLWAFRRRHGTPDLNRISTLLSVPVCWAYVLMAGAPVPAVRSAGMITLAVFLWNGWHPESDLGWSLLFFPDGRGVSLPDLFALLPPVLRRDLFPYRAFAGGPQGAPRLPTRWLAGWAEDALVAVRGRVLEPCRSAPRSSAPCPAAPFSEPAVRAARDRRRHGAFLAAVAGSFSIDAMGGAVRLAANSLHGVPSLLLARLSGRAGVRSPSSGGRPRRFAARWLPSGAAPPEAGKGFWPAPLAAASAFLVWILLPYAALPDARLTVTALNVGKGQHVVSSRMDATWSSIAEAGARMPEEESCLPS
jgi:hypothetical protein